MPQLAVVIAAYNASEYLEDALSSVAEQDLEDWVCVVVDDGSSDATPELAAAWARRDPRFLLLRQDNAGPGAARNLGLVNLPASVEAVTFRDASELRLTSALRVAWQHSNRCSMVLTVGCQVERFAEDGTFVGPGWFGWKELCFTSYQP
ncbi:MAG: glycosyltransferase family 2 protein [Fimbriimonadaceae bacterium]